MLSADHIIRMLLHPTAFEFGDRLNLKLYQKEECKILRLLYRPHGDEPLTEIDWAKDLSSIHRFERFVNSVVGFHKVGDLPRLAITFPILTTDLTSRL